MRRSACLLAVVLCAWVLWEDVESTRGGTKERSVRPIDATESRDECHALLARRMDDVASRTANKGWRRTRTAGEFLEISPDGTLAFNVRLTCLPNGTDPRPRS